MVSGFAVAASIAIAAYTANTVDQYVMLPYAFMVAGMCVYEGRRLEQRKKMPQEAPELPGREFQALSARGGQAEIAE